jgi:single-strand DNA-binding protein
MNIVTMTGNLTRDPETRDLEDGRLECKLRLAVDNGPYPSTFIDVRTFDAQAEACALYLRKGRQAAVMGRLVLAEWSARDGSPRQRYSVIGRVEFLDKPWAEGEVSGDRGGSGGADSPSEAEVDRQPELALVA